MVLLQNKSVLQLEQPEENIQKDELIEQNASNYILSDIDTTLHDKELGTDSERIKYVKLIKLETNFFNAFRNTIRILLNNIENVPLRQQIESIVESPTSMYYDKIVEIVKILREISANKLEFVEYEDKLLDQINTVNTCLKNNTENCDSKPHCITTEDSNCKMMIPISNLLTGKNNERIYFTRMADEILRYGRIRLFLFKPQAYLSFQKVGYNLEENEIILLETILKRYTDGLEPETKSEYFRRSI